jgi:hypothetical protein
VHEAILARPGHVPGGQAANAIRYARTFSTNSLLIGAPFCENANTRRR